MGRPVASASLANRSLVRSLTLIVVLMIGVYTIVALMIYSFQPWPTLSASGVVRQITIGRRNRAWAAEEVFDLLDEFDFGMASLEGLDKPVPPCSDPPPSLQARSLTSCVNRVGSSCFEPRG